MDLTAEQANAAVTAAAVDGQISASGSTRAGRPTWIDWPLEQALEMVANAAGLAWVDDDPDGLRVHVTTPGGRLYRIAATQ